MNELFAFHKLNEDGIKAANTIAEGFNKLLGLLNIICSEGREFAICKTHLEEACFYAKKAMAKLPANQE